LADSLSKEAIITTIACYEDNGPLEANFESPNLMYRFTASNRNLWYKMWYSNMPFKINGLHSVHYMK